MFAAMDFDNFINLDKIIKVEKNINNDYYTIFFDNREKIEIDKYHFDNLQKTIMDENLMAGCVEYKFYKKTQGNTNA